MTTLPWMKVYVGDEAALTGHLSAEEFGAYERLRRYYWQHGSPPDDEARLQRITGVEPARWPAVCSAITSLFDAGWRLERVDQERTEAADKRERKVASGKLGALKRWTQNGKPNGTTNGIPNGSANGITMPSANGISNSHQHQTTNSAYDKEVLTHAHPHAREAIPAVKTKDEAGQWLLAHDVFPGDLDDLARKMVDGDLVWSDVERSAA
ncbi:YdaU family protein [Mesorhizobium australicum]|uniref:YdaU family protein n=1 Tax=Mesorhizobium australicum TaxID=536018 RepID=A0ACC6SU19_9HYPH